MFAAAGLWLALFGVQASAPASADAQPAMLLQSGLAALRAQQDEQALKLFEQALAVQPDSATANLLAASAAVQLLQAGPAVRYAERARALDPNSWRVDTTLVAAYSIAGRTRERDEERAKLRALHQAGTERDAAETSGFLLDRFRAGNSTVDAVEYFAPVTKAGIYYRFVVHPAGTLDRGADSHMDVASDPLNERSWAAAHPQQAAAGERQFQILNTAGEQTGSFSGMNNYDTIKQRVLAQMGVASNTPAPQP